jgi:hypothetical protein
VNDIWRERVRAARRRITRAGLLAVAVLAVATVVALAAERGPRAEDPSAAPGAQAAQQHAAREQARRATPEARVERMQSRRRYGNASNERALAVAREKFADALTSDVWEGARLAPGERIRKRLNPYALQVDSPDSDADAIVESNVPLEVKDESGELAPVELALEDAGAGALESRNPIVPVRYFKDARRGFELERTGIGVHPVGAPGPDVAPLENADDRAFFSNVDRDTDFWVTPQPSGAQAQWQLRSQDSPERLALGIDLPRDATLQLHMDGNAEIARGDANLATISPPAAVDADGQQVPVHYEKDGSNLVVAVDHRAGDYLYPIMVDPDFSERYDWVCDYWPYDCVSGNAGWQAQSYGPFYMFYGDSTNVGGAGLYILGGAVAYTDGQWAEWYRDPWRAHINIPRAEFQTSQRSQYTCTYTGIWTNPGQYRDTNCFWYDGRWNTQCLPNACTAGLGWDYIPNETKDFGRATYGYFKSGAGTPCCTHWTVLRRSQIYFWDYYAPSVDIPDLGSRPWAEQDSATLTGSINDWGIGLAEEHVRAAGAGGTPNPYDWSTSCLGSRSSQCPTSNPLPGGSLSLDTAAAGGFGRNGTAYREGQMPIYVDATERIGRTTTKRVAEFKIDRSAPLPAAGGTLKKPTGTWIKEGSYTLTDSPYDKFAGVQTDTFSVSPGSSDTATNYKPGTSIPCDASSGCPTNPPTHSWTWPTSGSDGARQVTVTAKDPLGHVGTDAWTVNVDSRAPTLSAGPSGSLWTKRGTAIEAGSYDLHASATDPAPGSGVQDIKVMVNGIEEDSLKSTQSCGLACPASMPRDFTFDTTGRTQGRYRIQFVAHDKVGHPTTIADVTVVFDTTPPDVTMSGPLWNARDTELAPGAYNLHVQALDGDSTDPGARSGVRTVEIFVDGEPEDSFTQSCPQMSCSVTRDWVYNTADYSGGPHDVYVAASDQLGHERETATFTVSNPCCIATVSSWGTYAPSTYDVAYADVDADGAADLVARNKLTGDVQVGLSTGTSFASLSSWGSFSPTNDLHLADVDGNGAFDLVGRNAAGLVSVGLSSGSAFATATAWGTLPVGYDLLADDMDQDGLADVVGRSPTTGDFVVGWSSGTAFDPTVSWGSFDPAYTLALADVDGDGAADLAGVNPSTGDVRVTIANAGTLSPATSWGTGAGNSDATFGDADGDGSADLILRDRDSDGISFLPSTGSSFGTAGQWGSFNSATGPPTSSVATP